MVSIGKLIGGLILVAAGCGFVFAGFELAAYEKTLEDREVTTQGTVMETDVYQLPDGNWTYEFTYEYDFNQEEEIREQGLEEVYPRDMTGERTYTSLESGGKSDTESSARRSMERNFNDDGSVTVYIDPFNPDDSSLTDATSIMPRLLQYVGSGLLAFGLLGLSRMARRVSA